MHTAVVYNGNGYICVRYKASESFILDIRDE